MSEHEEIILGVIAIIIAVCIEIWLQPPKKKAETEQEKTYRALRYLIYIIITLILIGITIKILLFYSILSL